MRIGITGGIGSGKSYVARRLSELCSVPVYDSDREARRLMEECEEVRAALIRLLGEEAYTPTGELCKPVVARFLFASAENAAAVNAIVHPAVKADFLRWAEEQEGDVLLESAILVEAGFQDVIDCLLAVSAPETLRLQRAMQRDGAGEEQIRERMAQQASEETTLQASDFVIINDGRDLLPQLKTLARKLHLSRKRNIKIHKKNTENA